MGDTPKYGLIYHASLVGQAASKNKGKISRVLAAKCSLGIRVDALSDETAESVDTTIGYEGRAKVEARLRQLEGGNGAVISSINKDGALTAKKTSTYIPTAAKASYNDSNDVVLETDKVEEKSAKKKKKDKKKRKADDADAGDDAKEAKKSKKDKKKKKSKE